MKVLDRYDRAAVRALLERDEFFWLDLVDPGREEIAVLGSVLGWHRLVVEGLLTFRQRPKMDEYGSYMLLVFYGAVAGEAGGMPQPSEVHLVVSGSYVVTVRRRGSPGLDELRARFAADGALGERFVVYKVLDTLTDSFFPVLTEVDEEIDQLEDAIAASPTNAELRRISELRRMLVLFRRIVAPERDLAARALDEINDLPGLESDTHDYFRDLYDHLIRISDLIDSYRDLLSGTMDVYLSTVSNRLNDISRRLTLVATIFLPLTFITGFFGQNFGWMVRHVDSLDTFLALGIALPVLALGALLAWFRRGGLLS